MAGRFEVVMAEALDRLSRDQEDVAGLFKRLYVRGIRIVTLAEGEIGDLHVGLKGTMNALYLKDLADKTRRGLRAAGSRPGRRAAATATATTSWHQRARTVRWLRGGRRINPDQAAVVRRIFPRLRPWPVAQAHRPCSQCRRRCQPERNGLGSFDAERQRQARHWHPEQRAVHRPAGLEPAALCQGP
jgi:hypothetical protein